MVDTAENGERAMQLVDSSPRPPDVIYHRSKYGETGGRLLGHEVVAKLPVAVIKIALFQQFTNNLLNN